MTFKDTETGPCPATNQNLHDTQRKMSGGLILEKQKFNWEMKDWYVELLNLARSQKYIKDKSLQDK